jgi:hypothetical protein
LLFFIFYLRSLRIHVSVRLSAEIRLKFVNTTANSTVSSGGTGINLIILSSKRLRRVEARATAQAIGVYTRLPVSTISGAAVSGHVFLIRNDSAFRPNRFLRFLHVGLDKKKKKKNR